MDPSNLRYILLFLFLLICSACCSLSETAFSTVSRIRLVSLADDGDKRAKNAISVLDNFNLSLTTLLIANNIVNSACAAVATIFTAHLFVEAIANNGSLMTAITTAVTTILVFLFGEMIPKSFAADQSEKVALTVAGPIRFLSYLMYPVSMIFIGFSRLIELIIHPPKEPTVTEEELSSIIETSEEEGVLDEDQSELLQSALEFSETTVADVLVLRDDVEWIDISSTKEEIFEKVRKTVYSRLPVCRGSLDHPVGILIVTDFLKAYISGKYTRLVRLLHKPYFTTLDARIDDLKDEMSAKRQHIALVRDRTETSVIGIVTMEDFLEELVGEIYDETDVVDDNFMKLGGNYFRVSGKMTLGEMCEQMHYHPTGAYPVHKPLSTWILEMLGRIPEEEDEFTWQDLTVEIDEVAQNRVLYATVKLADPMIDSEPAPDEEEKGGEDA